MKGVLMLDNFLMQHGLPKSFANTANKWFVPVANELSDIIAKSKQPFFIGINGCQGSGKSTLADFLASYFQENHQINCAVLSLDDFYLSSNERDLLGKTVHPLLKTRGVPGTHDIQHIHEVLKKLSNKEPTRLPRFNKAIDNPYPEIDWPIATNVDVVIFEGWCWGVTPEKISALDTPCNALEKKHDSENIWRRYVNEKLASYQTLYEYMDTWLMLRAPAFSTVHQWRWQQEQKLAAKTSSSEATNVMTETEVAYFIQHFERLTKHCLNTLPQECNYVFQLDSERNISDLRSAHAK